MKTFPHTISFNYNTFLVLVQGQCKRRLCSCPLFRIDLENQKSEFCCSQILAGVSIKNSQLNMANDYSYEQLMEASLAAQGVFTFCYFISSLVVVGNAYNGFNAVILSFVFIAMIALMFMKMRKDVSRTMFGIVLGLIAVLVFVTLESSIFWGQYGSCDSYNNDDLYPTSSPTKMDRRMLFDAEEMIEDFVYSARRLNRIGVQCNHKSAMRSVCAFSVFMFLSYLFQIALLIRYKDEILKTSTTDGYAPVPSGSSIKSASSSVSSKSSK